MDRGRKGDDDGGDEAMGEFREEDAKAGCEGDSVVEASEAADWDLDVMGTMRFCTFESEVGVGSVDKVFVSSGGISSAAGIGRPLPAATN